MNAGEVAMELRRIADALDKEPELELAPYFSIETASATKEDFTRLARIMPRPMKKGIDFEDTTYSDFKLEHSFWRIKIPQSNMCRLVRRAQPAKYDCEPIFTAAEEDALASAE